MGRTEVLALKCSMEDQKKKKKNPRRRKAWNMGTAFGWISFRTGDYVSLVLKSANYSIGKVSERFSSGVMYVSNPGSGVT